MTETTHNAIDDAVSEGGAYEVLKARLSQQGETLKDLSQQFNLKRQQTFGGSDFALIGKANVQTNSRCVPVDMAQVNGQILFGYQVYVGLKASPALSDVFGVYTLNESDGTYRLDPIQLEASFLNDAQFTHEFSELFTYYKDARLSQISRQEDILYLAFQIGMRSEDRKVFRFEITAEKVRYLDSLGQVSLNDAPQHDFSWVATGRNDHINGDHPHVSIADKLFVECVGGDLTIKIEDNTDEGQGIYRELVEDAHQSVADAEISYAFVGDLIVLKVLPNREKHTRYFIYNPINQQVIRTDALSVSGKALPENHGLLYPRGYVLTGGEHKHFDGDWQHLRFFHKIASPNGEDVLYFFFNVEKGYYVIYVYNLIEKAFSAPMHSHGCSLYPDGRMLMFRVSENAEASTIHPLRIWNTPFMVPEHYAHHHQQQKQGADPFLANLGNTELVRALSSLLTICQLAQTNEVSQAAFETLLKTCQTTLDHYDWLDNDAALGLSDAVTAVMATADSIIDEFAKVRQLQQHAESALAQQSATVQDLVGRLKLAPRDEANVLLALLAELKAEVGCVMALRQHRYMPEAPVDTMLATLADQRQLMNNLLLTLLQEEKAYRPYKQAITAIEDKLKTVDKTAELNKLQVQTDQVRTELALVTEEVAEIETDDPTQATRILDLTTEVTSMLNAASARLRQKHQSLRGHEAKAEFSSQFKLLAQAVNSAMEQSQSPEQCDEQLAKLIGLLEKLESRFADFDEFLAEIYTKRDEIQSTLEGHKQQLISAQQRRVQNLNQAATVTFTSIEKRVTRFDDVAALNSFFATDNMVMKLRQLAESMRNLGDSVKADAIDSKLKAVQDQSLRALRDNQDIFEQGGNILRLGKHRFSVNKQALDLTLVDYQDTLSLHVSGTEYYQPVTAPEFLSLQAMAKMDVASETPAVYRAEYLAYLVLDAAQRHSDGWSIDGLQVALQNNQLLADIQQFAAPRYREGYVKGVHDHDAEKILAAVLPCYAQAGLLRFGQAERASTLLWLANLTESDYSHWHQTARNAVLMQQHLGANTAFESVKTELSALIPSMANADLTSSAEYAIAVLAADGASSLLSVDVSRDAIELCDVYLSFRRSLGWQADTTATKTAFAEHYQWLCAYTAHQATTQQDTLSQAFVVEASMLAVLKSSVANDASVLSKMDIKAVEFSLLAHLTGLLGDHPRVVDGGMTLVLDEFLQRGSHHQHHTLPQYEAYLTQRAALLTDAKSQLRLNEFLPRPLTSFVRNKLISDSYLHLIGDNLAKQMGTVGANKRTDLMGMLLLISPPGYGKTTLIEYVAHKLGLVFMKINGPSIGHQVTSLDPSDAPDQNAAREVEKINLAFEMGNNVLLYLDDIQHTNPEFLQKFISLCDGTRRVEGTWQGQTKTYDMRGKKFAVVMAGNPYTESGDVFTIPDMLANRADIYNLGDMLSDQKNAFELSFIENSLTSNPVLAPLATRDLNDLYQLINMAQGEKVALSDLTHPYSATEANEIVATLQKMLVIQQTVLRVNQQYIASAATADAYRVEPPFKLQGSYRNMNKLAEKVSSVMTDNELQTLVQDHYQGEAQTLTSGTEENLLKLAELRGNLSPEQQARWQQIKEGYYRKQQSGDDGDRAGQIVQQMVALNQNIHHVASTLIGSKK
ncbi:DNA repair ATPase [Photobacterium nomapromontoriensis]|uniref:DNA repair ATPase n=1 Tax=Photobacterium nomapromontoriensis TaxID=2910237 RepID=UPI003D0B16FE